MDGYIKSHSSPKEQEVHMKHTRMITKKPQKAQGSVDFKLFIADAIRIVAAFIFDLTR